MIRYMLLILFLVLLIIFSFDYPSKTPSPTFGPKILEGVVEHVEDIGDNKVKVIIDSREYVLFGRPELFYVDEYNTIILGSSGKSAEEVFLGEGVIQEMARDQ